MKDKVSIIAFFTMLGGFVVLATSVAIPNEKTGIAALLLILPSITINIAMRWINVEKDKLSVWINIKRDKVSLIAFLVMLSGFLVLVASFAIPNEHMGLIAMLLIMPSVTLNVIMQWISSGSKKYLLKSKLDA
jgi:hypothetical membrane protein